MNLIIDYDGTYTADPEFWDEFIKMAQSRGHSVKCVTMRFPEEAIKMPCDVIYTSRQPKIRCVEEPQNHIWIDDNPYWIFNNG